MTLQPCFSSTNHNLSKPQEWSFSKSYFVDIVLIFSEVNSLCLWNSILWRRYKWIKIVLKHFHKEREWCHSSLRYFATEYNYIIRISHRRFSVREGVLTKFTRKHLRQSLFFNKVAGWHRCFPVNFAKCLRTPFLQNTFE